jgi:hypothetical protein
LLQEEVDYQDIDWWSKYYASIGETEKCQKYLNKDMDKIAVSKQNVTFQKLMFFYVISPQVYTNALQFNFFQICKCIRKKKSRAVQNLNSCPQHTNTN